jgi:hypothetical protein
MTPFLVGELDRGAHLAEQLQPLPRCELVGAAVVGDRHPRTSSMTKNGRPCSVVPASRTVAMFGWSISARACRSASNRATTCRVSMPGLITFSATFRWTGWVCSATNTCPIPPSPICSISLYGPMVVPGSSVTGS